MPRFHLNVQYFDREPMMDREGAEFPSVAEAKLEAIAALRELAATFLKTGDTSIPREIAITDDDGRELCTVSVHDIVPAELCPSGVTKH